MAFNNNSFISLIPYLLQGRLPLTGTAVTRHAEDADSGHYAFDVTGLRLTFCARNAPFSGDRGLNITQSAVT